MNEATKEKWFTDKVEIARGPMKAVTEPGVRTITVMCSTQLMKTELILNTIGYFVHMDPCPILVVQPKEELAKKFSHVRLKEMIKSTPALQKLFVKDKSRDSSNTALYKEFHGGQVVIVSAKSPGNLAMLAIRVVLLDEIDKYDESSGKEGDPIDLAEERMSKYTSNSLSIRVCSPTIANISKIERSYNSSDMRKPFVECPHCKHRQIMLWKNVVWEKNDDGTPRLETTSYCCDACGVAMSEYERLMMLKTIVWRQTAEFNCGTCQHVNKPALWNPDDAHKWDDKGRAVCEECHIGKCSNQHAGFWGNKIYSPFRPLSEMVKLFYETKGNVEKLKTFVNTQLAEPFEDSGDQIKDVEWLMARRENFAAEVPDGVGIITAGIDTQNNRLEVEVVGWGLDEESWSLAHKIIPGDPKDPDTWKQLDEFLLRPWTKNDGSYSFIIASTIDMGGGHTQYVANYCRHRINRRVWPIRGVGGMGRAIPVWPMNPSRAKYDVQFYNVGVDAAKTVVFGRLHVPSPGHPGYCHFPHDRPEDWFKQLTAEKRVTKWKGSRKIQVWENPKKARNEAFDCRVYAYAALCGLQSLRWNINSIIESGKLFQFSEVQKAKIEKERVLNKPIGQVKSKNATSVKSNFMNR